MHTNLRALANSVGGDQSPLNCSSSPRRLAQAEQRVAEGKAFIAQQQQLVVESERDGHDAAESWRLLEKFLKLQQSLEFDRGQILDELFEIS